MILAITVPAFTLADCYSLDLQGARCFLLQYFPPIPPHPATADQAAVCTMVTCSGALLKA